MFRRQANHRPAQSSIYAGHAQQRGQQQ